MKARPNLIAQQDIDDVMARDRAGEAQVASAQAALSAAREQLQVSRATQDRVNTLLAYCRITAPFAGVVTKRYADTGAMVQAGTASNTQAMPVVRLSQVETLRLVIQGTDIYRQPRPLMQAFHDDSVNGGRHVIHTGGRFESHLLIPRAPG